MGKCVIITLLLLFSVVLWGQSPQTHDVANTEPLFRTNSSWSNGIATGYWPTCTHADTPASQTVGCSGLTLYIGPGTAICNGKTTYAGGTLTMTNNTTNYVKLNVTNEVCTPSTSTTAFKPADAGLMIADVVTSGGVITAINDDRTTFSSGAGFRCLKYVPTGDGGDLTCYQFTAIDPTAGVSIVIQNPGAGYAGSDTGVIVNCPSKYSFNPNKTVTYTVTGVGGGGAVTSVSVTGTLDTECQGSYSTTVTTGAGNGSLLLDLQRSTTVQDKQQFAGYRTAAGLAETLKSVVWLKQADNGGNLFLQDGGVDGTTDIFEIRMPGLTSGGGNVFDLFSSAANCPGIGSSCASISDTGTYTSVSNNTFGMITKHGWNMSFPGSTGTGGDTWAFINAIVWTYGSSGAIMYCSDCDTPASQGAACTSAGDKAGAEAHRIRNAWHCY